MSATDPLGAIRDIALGFPEATEKETWGHPTFRVRDKWRQTAPKRLVASYDAGRVT